jgi:hypothetical protein
MIDSELTHDFWTITLPANLDSSSARNPALFAYVAAQNRLNAPVLFSHKKISELLDPTLYTVKKAMERHHLFPRGWLEKQGITDRTLVNQMGNYALLEWPENIAIGAKAPTEYVPHIRKRFSETEWATMCELHALPPNWQEMDYTEFLIQRRQRMADIIRRGFNTLC